MYDKLLQEAYKIQLEIEPRIHLDNCYRFHNHDLQHVEEQFHEPVVEPIQSDGYVQILEGANRRAEVHGIARKYVELSKKKACVIKILGLCIGKQIYMIH